jgi:hypothetical protein
MLGLYQLVYLAETYPDLFLDQVRKQTQTEASDREYPFAAVGINITFMLVDVFKLHPQKQRMK